MKDVEAALDALYAGPVETFTAERDALAKELKTAGDKDGAAKVKAAHKPTVAGHALNRVVREARAELDALLAASKALATGKDFKDSLEKQRAALAAMSKKVGAIAPAELPAIISVLQGAAVDPALEAALKQGRFAKIPDAPVGFLGVAPVGPPPAPPPPPEPEPERKHPPLKAVPSVPEPPPPPPKPKVDPEVLAAAEKDAREKLKEAETLEAEAREANKLAIDARTAAKKAATHLAELKAKL